MKFSGKEFKQIINERKRLLSEITIEDAYRNYYSPYINMTVNEYEYIVHLCDTALNKRQTDLEPFTKWMISCYLRNPKDVKGNKERLLNCTNNIGVVAIQVMLEEVGVIPTNVFLKFRSVDAFITYIEKKYNEYKENIIKDNVKKVYEDGQWEVLLSTSPKASQCLAPSLFDENEAPPKAYFIYEKSYNDLYIFDMLNKSFMNEYGSEINPPVLSCMGASSDLIRFFERQYGKDPNYRDLFHHWREYCEPMEYGDLFYDYITRKYVVVLTDGYYIDRIDRFLELTDYYVIYERNGDIGIVAGDDNITDVDDYETISSQFVFYKKGNKGGIAGIHDGRYNEVVTLFDGDLFALKDFGSRYVIFDGDSGEKLLDEYDDITYIDTDMIEPLGVYKVRNSEEKENLLLWDGELLFEEWVDKICDGQIESQKYGSLFVVEVDEKYNLYGDAGMPVSNVWFDEISVNGKNATVMLNGNLYQYIVDEGILINTKTKKRRYVVDY